jgi:hypothetical protein
VSKLNPFPGYARAGMPSDKVRPWKMAAYGVKELIGKPLHLSIESSSDGATRAEAWLLMDRLGKDVGGDRENLPWAVDAGLRRQTACLIPERELVEAGVIRRAVSSDELVQAVEARLVIGLFGVNGAEAGEKSVWLNGGRVAALPAVADEWKTVSIPINPKLLKSASQLEVRRSTNVDKFKFRQLSLRLRLADGSWVSTPVQDATQTTDRDWAHFEGSVFPQPLVSAPVTLEFKNE